MTPDLSAALDRLRLMEQESHMFRPRANLAAALRIALEGLYEAQTSSATRLAASFRAAEAIAKALEAL